MKLQMKLKEKKNIFKRAHAGNVCVCVCVWGGGAMGWCLEDKFSKENSQQGIYSVTPNESNTRTQV